MRTLYFHIGLPKTATSFLQGEVFPRLKDVNYINIKKRNLKDLLTALTKEELEDEDYKKIREKLSEEVGDRNSLVSSESLFGDVYGRESKNRITILEDIKKTFTNLQIKIIVGIREQATYLTSLYKQYLHEGGTRDLRGFLSKCNTGKIFFDSYKYSNYVGKLISLFGKDNIYIYVFEQLKEDKEGFLRGLLDFLGEQEIPELSSTVYNKGYGVYQMKLAICLNRFFKSELNPEGFFPKIHIPKLGYLSPRLLLQNRLTQKIIYKEYRMPSEISQEIKRIYLEDNIKIKEKYRLNLPSVYFV